jgi:hypothetical protein
VVGHDTGFVIAYALAADHPDRGQRVALAEVPGSPGAAPSPPVFVPGAINDRLWHLPFNRLEKINEQLVKGREAIFFGWEFDAAARKLPDDVIAYYVRGLSDPDSLRGSFGFYRALDTTIAQDGERKNRRLTMPVLAIGGAASFGEHVGQALQLVADDVQSVVIPDTGHFVAEEAPDEMLGALTAFLAPYRDGLAEAHDARPHAAVDQRRCGGDEGPADGGAFVSLISPGTRPCARRAAPRTRPSACARAGTSGTGPRSDREPSPCRCERRFRSRARRR